MRFVVSLTIYLVLFATSYVLMKVRAKVKGIVYGSCDMDVPLFSSLFAAPIAIVYAIVEIVLAKLDIN